MTLQQQQEREEQQKARDAFWSDLAAGMSHEIRNPLVAIKTFAQLLPERHEDADFRNEFSRMVPEEIERLNGMLDQIQRFAQPGASARRNVDVRSALRRALARVLPEPSVADPRVDWRGMDQHLPPTWAYEESLVEAFVQLLTNAVEAVREAPQPLVVLSARKIEGGREHGRLLVSIRDNGGGIPPDIRDQLFSAFCTTKARGFGLGLPLVQRILDEIGGRFDLQSDSGGTQATLLLPPGRPAGSAPTEERAPEQPPT